MVCVVQLIGLLLDLPAIAAGAVVMLTALRAPRLYRLLRSPTECPSAGSRRAAAYVQLIALLFDVLCFVLGVGLLLPTLYRVNSTRRAISRTRRLLQRADEQRDARLAADLAAGRPLGSAEYSLSRLGRELAVHSVVTSQFFALLIDLPFLCMRAVVSCCLWRTVILWRELLAVRDSSDANPDIDLHPARVRRRIAFVNFVKVRKVFAVH